MSRSLTRTSPAWSPSPWSPRHVDRRRGESGRRGLDDQRARRVPTIQGAIDSASNGDTVVVAPGTYHEHIDFTGKNIEVKSSAGPATTIIDGDATAGVVTFKSGETSAAVLRGFTIQNGVPTPGPNSSVSDGAGIRISNASPLVIGNVIQNNDSQSYYAAGIGIFEAAPTIKDNVLQNNCSGSAIYGHFTDAVIEHNTVKNNMGCSADIAVNFLGAGTVTVIDNVIEDNAAGLLVDRTQHRDDQQQRDPAQCRRRHRRVRHDHVRDRAERRRRQHGRWHRHRNPVGQRRRAIREQHSGRQHLLRNALPNRGSVGSSTHGHREQHHRSQLGMWDQHRPDAAHGAEQQPECRQRQLRRRRRIQREHLGEPATSSMQRTATTTCSSRRRRSTRAPMRRRCCRPPTSTAHADPEHHRGPGCIRVHARRADAGRRVHAR